MTNSVPFKRVARIIAGQAPPSDGVKLLAEGLPFVQGNAEFGTESPSPLYECSTASKVAESGDLLISVRAPVGALNIARGRLGIGRGLAAIRTHGSDQRFTWWWLHSQSGVLASVSRGTTYAAVTAEDIGNLAFPQFDYDEQRRIADFLDAETARIDQVQVQRSAQLTKLTEQLKARLSVLFADSESGTDTRIKYLLAARPRYGVLVPELVSDGVPFIRVNNLLDLSRGVDGLARIPEELSAKYPTTVTKPGDLLLSVVGTLGRTAVVNSDIAGSNVARAVSVLRLLPGNAPELLAAWTGTAYFEEQARRATGTDTAQPTLGMEDLSNFTIRWPADRRERAALLERITEVTASNTELRASLNRQTKLVAERRQALITAAVTGQFDVTTARSFDSPGGAA